MNNTAPTSPTDPITTWKRVTREHFWEKLEILPPAFQTGAGFLIGEPTRHNRDGRPMYRAYREIGDAFYESVEPLTVAAFRALRDQDVLDHVVEPVLVYRTVDGKLARCLIPPKEITIIRAEGPSALCGKVQKASDWIEANGILRGNAATAPDRDAYDKHDFKIVFDDGYTYDGRYDLKRKGPYDLAEHVRGFVGYLAGTWTGYAEGFDSERHRRETMTRYAADRASKPDEVAEAKAWLLKYDVGQGPIYVDATTTAVEIVADFEDQGLAYANAKTAEEKTRLTARHGELKLEMLRRLRETYTPG